MPSVARSMVITSNLVVVDDFTYHQTTDKAPERCPSFVSLQVTPRPPDALLAQGPATERERSLGIGKIQPLATSGSPSSLSAGAAKKDPTTTTATLIASPTTPT